MAEPKKRTNKSKTNMRRMHDKVKSPSYGFCPSCHEPILPHTVCTSCGKYKEMQVVEQKTKKVSEEKKEDK